MDAPVIANGDLGAIARISHKCVHSRLTSTAFKTSYGIYYAIRSAKLIPIGVFAGIDAAYLFGSQIINGIILVDKENECFKSTGT